MKLTIPLASVACVIALAGCASTPTKVDHGPIRARSFSFINRGASPPPDYAESRQSVYSIIEDCITKNLATRGVRKITSGGDITVGYLLIVGNNTSTSAIDAYFGNSEDAAALREKAQAAYSSSNNPKYFEAGTLVIDIIDSKNRKLLRRGYASRQILRNPIGPAMAGRIQAVVDEILGNLQIAP